MSNCLYCSSQSLTTILEFGMVPTSSQTFYENQQEARNCKTSDLEISLCNSCGLIFNSGYKTNLIPSHNNNYYYSVSCSARSRNYQSATAKEIDNLFALSDYNVCEIGCGDGFFLNEISKYCKKAIGFEPSRTINLAKKYSQLELNNNYFNPKIFKNEKKDTDLFILRHIIEHLTDPFNFLTSLCYCYRKNSENKGLYLEAPDAQTLLKNNLYFDFYYDHIFYFTRSFLKIFLKNIGWNEINFMENKEDEFIHVLCTSGTPMDIKNNDSETDSSIGLEDICNNFNNNYSFWKNSLINLLSDIKKDGKKVAAWGAGSRGITMLLNLLNGQEYIDYVVDSDPNKQGKFIPLIAKPLVAIDVLDREPVDYVLVTSYTYFDEIVNSLEQFISKGLKIIKPYPNVEII